MYVLLYTSGREETLSIPLKWILSTDSLRGNGKKPPLVPPHFSVCGDVPIHEITIPHFLAQHIHKWQGNFFLSLCDGGTADCGNLV